MNRIAIGLVVLNLIILGPQAHAANRTMAEDWLLAGAQWSELTPAEQELLRKHRKRWSEYSSEEQDRIREGASRYMRMSPEEQRRVREKQQQYQQLTPEQRRELRQRYLQEKHKR
jgi:hypothetical protein